MMDQSEFNVFIELLREWIKNQFKYWKTYSATVKDGKDSITKKGGVFLECLDLLAKDKESYILAYPVGNPRSFVLPKVGDSVVLFFKDGDSEQARYMSEIPESFIKEAEEQEIYTIFDSPLNSSQIVFNEKEGFTIESKSDKGGDAPEPTVLGTKLKELLDKIFDDYFKDIYTHIDTVAGEVTTHMHPTSSPGAPTGPPNPPTSILLQKLKGDIGAKKGGLGQVKSGYGEAGKLLSKVNKIN